jgi:uncharacterized damage-inducible protein DinB
MDLLDRLLEHDRWATNQLLELSDGLSDAQLDQEFDVGHRTLRETFHHMIFNIEAWTDVIEEQPIQAVHGVLSVAALREWHDRAYDEFAVLARRVRDEGRMEDLFVDSYGERLRYGGAIVHVILHNAEHRTDALHILSRLGLPEVPEVDHALWDHVSRGAQV